MPRSPARTKETTPDVPSEADPRRRAILAAALQVFARFGYRRASMDEVARAAQLSRQGLYFHFATKDVLFRASVAFLLEESLGAGKRALLGDGPLEDRLVEAFDAVYGAHVGGGLGGSSHVAELLETSRELLGNVIEEGEQAFRVAIARTLVDEGIVPAKASPSAKDVVATLDAVANGLKHAVRTREELRARMRTAIRVICRTRG